MVLVNDSFVNSYQMIFYILKAIVSENQSKQLLCHGLPILLKVMFPLRKAY